MMNKNKFITIFSVWALIVGLVSCNKNPASHTIIPPSPPPVTEDTGYKTKNVIIVVVDGARYTETWGDPSHTYIPKRYALLQQGVLCNALYNNGTTSTVPGHTAMTTGYYQFIANDGTAIPEKPSIFQHWLQTYSQPSSKAWVIATKDKLEVLSDCVQPEWQGKFRPMTDCGVAGLGTGYRTDSVTFKTVQTTLSGYHPQLLLINFKQPDAAGHAADSAGYLKGILDTDNYIDILWNQLQNDFFYKDKTTMIVVNDHGRHTAGHLDGFVSHGDDCDGCRHIEMFAIGPDFKKNFISNTTYDQVDVASTVAALLNFKMPYSDGKIMSGLFR